MEGLLEGSREDLKQLLSKLGFAVSLPLAGYLVVNSNLRSSASSDIESADSGADRKSAIPISIRDSKRLKDEIHILERMTDGQSAIHASTSGGKNLKDEIHIQENEEALAKIIHGTSVLTSITKAIDEHSPLPKTQRSLMRLTDGGFEAKQVEMEQEIKESGRSHLREYCGSKDQRAVVTEIEDHLKIIMVMTSSLPLKIESLNEQNRRLRIQDSEYSGMISELASVRMIIHYLMKALKSDLLRSTHNMTVLEQQITMYGSRNDEEWKNNEEAESNSKMLMELKDKYITLRENILSSEFGTKAKMLLELEDDCIKHSEDIFSSEPENSELAGKLKDDIKVEANSMTLSQVKDAGGNLSEMTVSSEKKNSELVGMREFEENLVSFPYTPKDQDAEVEEIEKEREIEQPSGEHHNTKFVENLIGWQTNSWLEYEQDTCNSSTENAAESYDNESLAAKTRKEAEEVVIKKNEYSKDPNKGNFPSQQTSSESMSCSPGISLITSNSSIDRSKNHSAQRTKIPSKLKKMFLGKHSHRKGKTLTSKTPIDSSSSSYRKESVSTTYSDDSSRNSRLSDLSCSSLEKNTTVKQSSKTSSDRWQRNTAWCQSFYRTPFDVSRAKVFALQEDNTRAFYEAQKGKTYHA